MPKPGKENLEEEVELEEGAEGAEVTVEDEGSEEQPGESDGKGGRVINLDEEEAADEEAAAAAKEGKGKNNAAYAKMRIELKKIKKENEELKKKAKETPAAPQVVTPAQPAQRQTYEQREVINGIEVPQTEEEWDALVKKNWKVAVDLRAIVNARKIYSDEKTLNESNKTMEESKQRVAARHPELLDPSSEKTKVFLQVLAENPDFKSHPKGPIFAMREMEDRLESLGYKREDIVKASAAAQKEENLRQSRVVISSTRGRTPDATERKVTLTASDMEFCKINGIDPKEYAKNKFQMSKSKGAQL